MMFCRGRKDVYELRYSNPRTGKTGYYTQCLNRWNPCCHIGKRDGVRCKDCELQAYQPLGPLSKEDAEDNLMRVCSKDIAAELLEMTFGGGEMQEW
jgi:hypothetical protein